MSLGISIGLRLRSTTARFNNIVPLYTPAISAPIPTGTTTIVSTAAEFNTVYQASSSGDMILLADGDYDAATALPNGWNKAGVIVKAQNRGAYYYDYLGTGFGTHWALFERKAWIVYGSMAWNTNCFKITTSIGGIIDIGFRLGTGLWPADNASFSTTLGAAGAVGWPFISITSTAGDPKLFYCEFKVGYGNNCDPIDPSVKYIDSNSPNPYTVSAVPNAVGGEGYWTTAGGPMTGWGDATWLNYNRLLNCPYAVRKESVSSLTSLTLYGNYVHDISRGFSGCTSHSGPTIIQHNVMERVTQDFLTVSASASDLPSSIIVQQNIFIDPVANAYDSGNPHSDTNQVYISAPTVYPAYLRNIESNNNFLFSHTNCRGQAQFNFMQLSADHYNSTTGLVYGRGVKMRNNFAAMSGTSVAGTFGVSSGYIRNNMAFHPIGQVNSSALAHMTLDSRSGTNGTTFPLAKSGYMNNIFEGNIGTTGVGAQLYKKNNAFIGLRESRTIADSTIFSGSFASYPNSPSEMYNASKRSGSYATMGPQYSSLSDMILGTIDWTGEPPLVSWPNVGASTSGILTASGLSEVYGGDLGDIISMVPGVGLEWQTLLLDGTTVIQPWTTGSGTAAVGQCYMQVRATSPSAGNGQSFNYTFGGQTFTWAIATAPTIQYPRATLDGIVSVAQPAKLAIGSDSKTAFVYLQFVLDPAHASSKGLVGQVSGTTDISITITTAKRILYTIKDATGTTTLLAYTTSTVLATGVTIRAWAQIDMNQDTINGAMTVFIDNGTGTAVSDSPFSGSGYVQNSLIGFSHSLKRRVGPVLIGSLDAYWVKSNVLLDPSDIILQSAFNRQNIGTDGSGPTGSQPEIFLVGYDGLLNSIGTTTSTDSNLGTIVMSKLAGTWVTTNGEVWP